MTVIRVDINDVLDSPEFPALVEKYAAETAIVGMPSPKVKMETYRHYQDTGLLHVFAAMDGEALVGFIAVLAPVLPHYSCPVAVVESFFVAPAHRKGGTGLALLAAAEKVAGEVGSPGLLVSAPVLGKLSELLPKCGYRPTNVVFFKEISHEQIKRSVHEPAANISGASL